MTAAINRRNRRAQARSRRRACRKTTQIGASATTTWGYDSSDRLQYLRSGSLTRFTFSYDNNSNLKTTGSDAHIYDYAYDGNDNRTFASENGPQTFAYDAANRLTTSVDSSSVSTSYGYDTDGNLVEVAVDEELPVEMQYDEENRMIVHVDGLARTTFAYDGDGLKRSETTGSGRTTLIWDGGDYLQGRS